MQVELIEQVEIINVLGIHCPFVGDFSLLLLHFVDLDFTDLLLDLLLQSSILLV